MQFPHFKSSLFLRRGGIALTIGLGFTLALQAGATSQESSNVGAKQSRKATVRVEKADAATIARLSAMQPAVLSLNGQKVFIDPKSRRIREATVEELQELAAQQAPAQEEIVVLQPIHNADGSISVELDGRFLNFSVARIEADGSVTRECLSQPEQLEQFLNEAQRTAGDRRHEEKPDVQ